MEYKIVLTNYMLLLYISYEQNDLYTLVTTKAVAITSTQVNVNIPHLSIKAGSQLVAQV